MKLASALFCAWVSSLFLHCSVEPCENTVLVRFCCFQSSSLALKTCETKGPREASHDRIESIFSLKSQGVYIVSKLNLRWC